MLSCYIIDDESHAIELLTDYISITPGLQLMGSSVDPVKGLHEILAVPPDILFLDIDMPVLTGLDLVKLLNDKSRIIFTTGYANYAVESYNINAADFMLKPIRYERFLQSFKKVEGLINESKQLNMPGNGSIFLQVGVKGKLVKVKFDEIVFIESMNNYINIHLTEGHLVVYLSLRELIEKLPRNIFFRIHKSYIVNYTQVLSIEGNRVFLAEGEPLMIGNQYRDAFFKRVSADVINKR
ncbi:LytR/AlgR family response regulator transcription factor [Mucilaginibacter phyllosphaerae]